MKRGYGLLLLLIGLNILTWFYLVKMYGWPLDLHSLLSVRHENGGNAESASLLKASPSDNESPETPILSQTPSKGAGISIPQVVGLQAQPALAASAGEPLSLQFPSQVDELIRKPAYAGRMIVVDQGRQQMLFYQQGELLKSIPVSTGRPSNRTFTPEWDGLVGKFWGSGNFPDGTRADFIWFLFDGPEGRILIHSVPYRLVNGEKVYQNPENLGFTPSSNGCIHVSSDDAAWLRDWNPTGTPIHIGKYEGDILEVESGRLFHLP